MESLAAEVTTVQEEEVCRGERESVVAAWWLWWFPVVELVAEKPDGGWNGGEREGKKNCRNGAGGLVFGRLLTRFSPPSGH